MCVTLCVYQNVCVFMSVCAVCVCSMHVSVCVHIVFTVEAVWIKGCPEPVAEGQGVGVRSDAPECHSKQMNQGQRRQIILHDRERVSQCKATGVGLGEFI